VVRPNRLATCPLVSDKSAKLEGRCEPELKERLMTVAAENERSISAEMRVAIRRHVDDEEVRLGSER
jgi:predicted transcriptional regulator